MIRPNQQFTDVVLVVLGYDTDARMWAHCAMSHVKYSRSYEEGILRLILILQLN